MKVLSVTILASVLATRAIGCDLCGIYSEAEATGMMGAGFYSGVAEQFTRFGTLRDDGRKVANGGNYINSSVSQVFAGYYFNKRFGVQFNLPVIYRSFGSATDHGTESGLGDVALLGNFRVYETFQPDFTFTAAVLGGVKFPTGDSHRLGDSDFAPGIGGHDLALGSGSVDGIVGTALLTRWKRLLLTANLQYGIRSEGAFHHQYANDLTWAVGPGVYVA